MNLAKLDAALSPKQLEEAQAAGCRIFSSFSRFQDAPLGDIVQPLFRSRGESAHSGRKGTGIPAIG